MKYGLQFPLSNVILCIGTTAYAVEVTRKITVINYNIFTIHYTMFNNQNSESRHTYEISLVSTVQ
jgi:hypothetical protein